MRIDQWNRVVVELQRAKSKSDEPENTFYFGRVFINQQIPTQIAFGDTTTSPLFQDKGSGTIDICSTKESGTSIRNSSVDGNYDMMNLLWFQGEERAFQNPSGNRNPTFS